ncbi:MAG: YbdK family carboxylate-amine ligase [Desulfobulbaceae bacterium]|nr:YbdK family carboxylate-amine ligase [Desulfobulbaceae bacterium]
MMKQIFFEQSSPYSLGVELEFQILDVDTMDLVSRAEEMLALFPKPEQDQVAREFMQSIFEVQTGICATVEEVELDLRHMVEVAEDIARRCGCLLFASGIHPFARPAEQKVTDNERYLRIMHELQHVGRQFISQGLHVHIGMSDRETAVKVCDAIQAYLPLLLALSTSSPYFTGVDTGFHSYRTKLFEVFPLAGIAEYLGDWGSYEQMVSTLLEAGIIQDTCDLWWDVRPSPHFGTIEIRACDMPSFFPDIMALTALIQALAVHIVEQDFPRQRINPQILRHNKWQASRHGLKGRFNDPFFRFSDTPKSLGESVLLMLESLEPVMLRLGSARWAERIRHIVDHGTSTDRQRQLVREVGVLKDMVARLQGEFWS